MKHTKWMPTIFGTGHLIEVFDTKAEASKYAKEKLGFVKPLIIHKQIYKGDYNGALYLCNQAVGTRREKLSYFWKRVTCKNCLKKKP